MGRVYFSPYRNSFELMVSQLSMLSWGPLDWEPAVPPVSLPCHSTLLVSSSAEPVIAIDLPLCVILEKKVHYS